MIGVITGFAIILAVIAVGYLLARRSIIGAGTERLMFNRVAFFAATPALLFSSVAESDPGHFLSPVVLVIFLATAATAAVYCVISALTFRQDVATTAMGAASSSYFNSVNIGLPVSIYVIGDATHVVPVLVLQMVVFTPMILAAIGTDDTVGSGGRPLGVKVAEAVKNALLSPVVLASFAGLAVSLADITIPEPVMAPIEILGGASIPMILMSFGASLVSGGALSSAEDRPGAITATLLKVVGMPLIAWLIGLALGLDGDSLYVAVILAALPTAQNVYNYAATYERGMTVARDSVFLTTFASLPAMLVIALLFGR